MTKNNNHNNDNNPVKAEIKEQINKMEKDYYENIENEIYRSSLTPEEIKEAEDKYKNKNICNFTIAHQIPDDFDEDAFFRKLQTLTYIQNYAFIIHDKDVSENGTPAKRHYHLFCQVPNQKAINVIARDFDVLPYVVQKMRADDRNYYRATQYLVHLNHPEKYQYPFESVRASFDYRRKVFRDLMHSNTAQIKSALINLILSGGMRRYNLHNYFKDNKIPSEYEVYWKRDIDNAFKIADDLYLEKNRNRNLECYFIWGESGKGKTELAKDMARKRKLNYFITGSSNDIFDGYRDEEVIIIDDARNDMFSSYADVLRLIDPHNSTKYKARYYNKALKAKIIIFTSSHPIHEVFSFNTNRHEDHTQIYRRIPTKINVYPHFCERYIYSLNDRKYLFKNKFVNPLQEIIRQSEMGKKEEEQKIDWMDKAYEAYEPAKPKVIEINQNMEQTNVDSPIGVECSVSPNDFIDCSISIEDLPL